MPDGVLALVVKVRVVDPDLATDVGLKVAVTPDGKPPTVKLTVPAYSVPGISVTV